MPGIEWRRSPAERTLADEFNEAGHETVYVGKWHLDGGHGRMGSAEQTNLTPVRRPYQGRWQKWLGFELRNGPHDTWYFEDDDPTPKRIDGYQTDGLFDLAMDHVKLCGRVLATLCPCSVTPPSRRGSNSCGRLSGDL